MATSTTPRVGRGAPGYCVRCDEHGADHAEQRLCWTHSALTVIAPGMMDEVDAAADRAGISVACLVREAIARTVEGLKP